VCEPSVIKSILVKDFHLFSDRYHIRDASDQIASKTLFHMNGDAWRRVRAITSPTFSSGKMRKMYPLIRECLADMLTQLNIYATSGKVLSFLKFIFKKSIMVKKLSTLTKFN